MSGRRRHHVGRFAFTLIETMTALVILGLLAGAVAWTFAGPLRRARGAEAVEQVRYLDASTRDVARRFGRAVEMRFDLAGGGLERRGARVGDGEATFRATVASPWRIEAVRTEGRRAESGEVAVAVSPLGLSPTYAVKLAGPEGADGGAARWVVVSGLTGEVRTVNDDAQVESIFAHVASPAGAAARRDAD
jgi:prepilin-type N-terminal cleavage/methylation domain-containing protein